MKLFMAGTTTTYGTLIICNGSSPANAIEKLKRIVTYGMGDVTIAHRYEGFIERIPASAV